MKNIIAEAIAPKLGVAQKNVEQIVKDIIRDMVSEQLGTRWG